MREKDFVEQNKEKWSRLEKAVSGEVKREPEEINELYNQITGDLSYAHTYYNQRSIRVYLNQLAKMVYLSLYKRRRSPWSSFAAFWTYDLPLALYRSRKELNVSLVFFILSMGIGVLSSIHDPDFAQIILGSDYIRQTEENIATGKPMAIYASMGETDMFLRITLNNLLVAFRTYVLGAFFGVGTLIIMLFNGIMVGTFQYYFVEKLLFQESFLSIWMHGALEISAIVIAGGAGLTAGRGLLYPGTLPRIQSFQIGARRSIKIMLGLIPIFIVAAFIEGFFTRLTNLPDIARGSFIILCFTFVGLYFWFYPWKKFRYQSIPEYDADQLIPPLSQKLEIRLLRKTKEIFADTFVVFRKLFVPIFLSALAVAAIYSLAFWLLHADEIFESVEFSKFSLYNLYQFHSYQKFPKIFFPNLFALSAIMWLSFYHFKKVFVHQIHGHFKPNFILFLKILVITSIFELSILSGNILVVALGIIAMAYLLFWMATSTLERLSLPNGFSRMLKLQGGTKRNIFLTFSAMCLLSILLLFLIDSPFTWLYIDVLQWNISGDENTKLNIAYITLIFVNQAGLYTVIPLLLFGQILEYFSALEAQEGKELSLRVAEIGIKRKAYGLERE